MSPGRSNVRIKSEKVYVTWVSDMRVMVTVWQAYPVPLRYKVRHSVQMKGLVEQSVTPVKVSTKVKGADMPKSDNVVSD